MLTSVLSKTDVNLPMLKLLFVVVNSHQENASAGHLPSPTGLLPDPTDHLPGLAVVGEVVVVDE